jgi:hypothetical protein
MNKKFFTLIASALMLVASFGTVNAAVEIGGTGGAATELPYGNSGNLYQLNATTTGTGGTIFKLAVSKDAKVYASSASFSNFGESLWCVNISKENQGANPKFDFTNKSTGHLLAVSDADRSFATAADSINLNFGMYSGWGFSKTYEADLQNNRAFSTYYTADSVYVLVNQGVVAGKMRVGIKGFRADALEFPGGDVYSDPTVLRFTVFEPADLILNANEFNTKLNTQAAANVKLKFTPDRNNTSLQNPWSDNSLRASDSPLGVRWMRFQKDINNDQTFLRVDTSYANSVGVKFLNFAFDSVALEIQNQYDFQVRYSVTSDSISIQVFQARFNLEEAANWATSRATTTGINTGLVPAADSLLVKLQDLVKADAIRIITIGTEPVNTKAEFGIGGCAPTGINLTSLGNDLYVIKKGELTLVVPIYTDTVAPKWIKLDDAAVGGTVDPNYIPAYQWAVEKIRTDHPEISPIRITNREFPNIVVNNLQLRDDATSSLYGTGIDKTNFTAVPLEQKRDSLLGYKYITNDDSRFNTYVFNYLHRYNDEQFLNVKKIGSDTSLFVDAAKTQFELIRHRTGDQRYGYYTTDIQGLSRLKKVAYTVKVKDQSRNTNKYILINKTEKRYVVGGTVAAADTAVFLLKTNNTRLLDGAVRPYYALVDTGSYRVVGSEVVKVGIADETLWAYVQVQKETRTSAFAVQEWTEPLYRRFDGETYGSRGIEEKFGSRDNAPQWLKLTRQNNFGIEYLFENSPRGIGSPDPNKPNTNDYRDDLTTWGKANISFLGLYNRIQYPENGDLSNYTIYVDTAFVKRKSNGEGSTDYKEYTAKPQYMLAVRPEFVKGDTVFRITKDSVWDSNGKVLLDVTSDTTLIFRPSFTRAFYIFNAQDSIGRADLDNRNPGKADYVGKFTYGAEFTTRLAFVDGVHMGDTFYVLRNKPLTTNIDSAYLLGVPAADKHYLGANTHYLPRWNRNGTLAWGNSTDYYNNTWNGKSMVFQFRLIDPEGINDPKNAQSRAFLIESRNNEGFGGPTEEMGPQSGRWIKIQNGVPVVSERIDKDVAQQNGADIFNVVAGEENNAVGNGLAPTVSTVKVIGETGAVTILNAGGKRVAISNILGQTVAGTVISSDNATIALPKGIVVVAVEGEAAVKAIIK